jgi:hypothetical protein
LESLSKTLGDTGYTYLIVDNGSRASDLDSLYEYASSSDQRIGFLTLQKNSGFGGGVSEGLKWRRNHLPESDVCLINADVVFKEKGWWHRWKAFLDERPQVGVVGMGHAHFAALDGKFYDYRRQAGEAIREGQWVTGTVMGIPSRTLETLQDIDPYYCPGYWEDADFCFEVFWGARLDVWALPTDLRHFEMGASKLNNYQLTPEIQSAKSLAEKQMQNKFFFSDKWREVLHPVRSSLDQEADHLLEMKKLRDSGAIPPRLRKRLQVQGVTVPYA